MLNKFVAECDRKTENAKRKLHETQEELGEEAARKVKYFFFLDHIDDKKILFFLDEFYS